MSVWLVLFIFLQVTCKLIRNVCVCMCVCNLVFRKNWDNMFLLHIVIVSSMTRLQRSLCHADHCSQVICLYRASVYLAVWPRISFWKQKWWIWSNYLCKLVKHKQEWQHGFSLFFVYVFISVSHQWIQIRSWVIATWLVWSPDRDQIHKLALAWCGL